MFRAVADAAQYSGLSHFNRRRSFLPSCQYPFPLRLGHGASARPERDAKRGREMRISIVVSTINRCAMLRQTLESLRQQRYRDFEVVVVNGPSNDGTVALLEEWRGVIKIADCPVANLAVSRNIGINFAAGDIVGFIDDDAIPDPRWLERIVGAYDHPKIGAVGGFVYDHTGWLFQTTFITGDRFGGAI